MPTIGATVKRSIPGDLLMLYPDIAHGYGPGRDETWSEIFLVFDGPVFDLYRRQNLLDENRPIWQLSPIDYWLGRIQSVATTVGKESALQSICKLQLLIAEMRDHQRASGVNDTDRAWLARAMLLLEQTPSGPDFDLETVAEQLDTSYVGFRKRFVRLAGVSPGRFRSRAVMQRAAEMLRGPERSNREIAKQLGFCDEFHFSRRFNQMIGLSPREFLQQMPRAVTK